MDYGYGYWLPEGLRLRLFGCVLLLSGWLISLLAIVVLSSLHLRTAFVLAGLFVEVLGAVLLLQRYKARVRHEG